MGPLAQVWQSASGLAQGATDAGQVARGLSTTAAALGGISTTANFLYQGQVAANNSKLRAADAIQAEQAGLYEGSISKMKTTELIGEEKAIQAGNNVDVNVGSAVKVRQTTQNMGDLDALTIRYNAMKAAYGYNIDSQNFKTQAGLDRASAGQALAEGGLRVGASYIGGSNSLLNKSLGYSQVGLNG